MSDNTVIQHSFAEVKALQGVYDIQVPEMDPDGDPLFEVAFQTDQGIKIFWINSYDFYALKVGMKGELSWKGDQLISFGDLLKASFPIQ